MAIEANGAFKKVFTGISEALNPKNAIFKTASNDITDTSIKGIERQNKGLLDAAKVINTASTGDKDALTQAMDSMYKNSGKTLDEDAHATTNNINEIAKQNEGLKDVGDLFNNKGEIQDRAKDFVTKGSDGSSPLRDTASDNIDKMNDLKEKRNSNFSTESIKSAMGMKNDADSTVRGGTKSIKNDAGFYAKTLGNYISLGDVQAGKKLSTGLIRGGAIGAGIGGTTLVGHALFGDHDDNQQG